MNRIVTNDLTRHVLPLRTQSITGARMLHFLNYTVDAIYLDGAQVPTLPRLLPLSHAPACSGCSFFYHLSRSRLLLHKAVWEGVGMETADK